mmetsp:Transcript_42740/g.56430  ORF Transcript_42740/g.56430 Transcript_42740/m.56430 type:complete len:89 (-) Transcript_42740:135-401(-)
MKRTLLATVLVSATVSVKVNIVNVMTKEEAAAGSSVILPAPVVDTEVAGLPGDTAAAVSPQQAVTAPSPDGNEQTASSQSSSNEPTAD